MWTVDGFILAGDVRLTKYRTDGSVEHTFIHKILPAQPRLSGIQCALAVCGDDPAACRNFFAEACVRDTLREIAEHFAGKWTRRFAGTQDSSAIHIVGYERIPNSDVRMPQMWYWHNWSQADGFLSKERLEQDLSTFSDPIPANCHLPWKIRELTGKFPSGGPEDEYALVIAFLRLYQPFFTWNGDTSFWKSAAETVGAGLNLLWRQKTTWTLDEAVELTEYCLRFLTNLAKLLPASTVGVSPDDDFDVLVVAPENWRWIQRAKLPNGE